MTLRRELALTGIAAVCGIVAVCALSGCGGGGGGGGGNVQATDFPSFVKAQINTTATLDTRDAVPINDINFVNVFNEDPHQFDDILGN